MLGLLAASTLLPILARETIGLLLSKKAATSIWGQGSYFVIQVGVLLTLVYLLFRRYPGALATEPLKQGRTGLSLLAALVCLVGLVGPLTYWGALMQWTFLAPVFSAAEPSPETVQSLVSQLNGSWNNYYGWATAYSLFFSLFMVLVVGPIWEEALHSCFLTALICRVSPGTSVLLCGVLFCLPHLLLAGINLISAWQILLLFLVTGWARCWSGHWLTAVAVHSIANLLVMAMPTYLAVMTHLRFGQS